MGGEKEPLLIGGNNRGASLNTNALHDVAGREIDYEEIGRLKARLIKLESGRATDDDDHDGAHGASFLKAGGLPSAVYTLCAMSLGVGVFVLPSVLKDMGLVTGVVAILFFAFWSYYMQCVLIKVAAKQNPPCFGYAELAERTLGKFGSFLLALFTMITTFLGNASHMKTVVGLLEQVLTYFVTGDGHHTVEFSLAKELILYIFLLGIALFKSADGQINNLRFISTMSVGTVLLVCVWTIGECLFWYMPHGTHAFSGENRIILASTGWKNYASDLPAVAFAFSGTFCLFPVYKELQNKSYKNVRKAIGYSSIVCGVGYASIALAGVLTFGKNVDIAAATNKSGESNFLLHFPADHYIVTFLTFVLVWTITLLYAVINFPFLDAVTAVVEMMPCVHGKSKFMHSFTGRMVVTIIGMVFNIMVNLAFTNLKTLFGFCGGWGISFVVYFIPSLIALAASKDESLFYKMTMCFSTLLVLVMVGGFTYTLFEPP